MSTAAMRRLHKCWNDSIFPAAISIIFSRWFAGAHPTDPAVKIHPARGKGSSGAMGKRIVDGGRGEEIGYTALNRWR